MSARRFTAAAGAVAALVAAGAVAGLPRLAAAAAQRAFSEAFGPQSRVQLRFSSGLPLLFGRFDHLRLSAAETRISGLLVRRLSLSAERLHLDLPALIGARRLIVTRVHGLVAHFVVGERALNEHLAARGVRVRLDAGAAELSAHDVRARGSFTVGDGRVWFRPDHLWVAGVPVPPLLWQRWLRRLDVGRATVDLTGLPVPVRLTAVEVRPGELAISAAGPEGS